MCVCAKESGSECRFALLLFVDVPADTSVSASSGDGAQVYERAGTRPLTVVGEVGCRSCVVREKQKRGYSARLLFDDDRMSL